MPPETTSSGGRGAMPSLLEEDHVAPSAAGEAPRPRSRAAAVKAGIAVAALLAAVAITAWQFAGMAPDIASQTGTTLIDAETGALVKGHELKIGEQYPLVNPAHGRRTLWPAERCWWTRDGKVKPEPTFVMLKEYTGQGGETVCPDCGRRVVSRNPAPPLELIVKAQATGEPQ